jgi:hypothetical protein
MSSIVLSVSSSPAQEGRVEALRALFTDDHRAALAKHKGLLKKFPGFDVDEYLGQLAQQIDWTPHFVLKMSDYPEGGEGAARFAEDLREAVQNHAHVDIFGALTTDEGGNVIERMPEFARIHQAVAAHFREPTGTCVLHLVGEKRNTFPDPMLVAQIGEGRKFRLVAGGYTVPGAPQSEIDFVIRAVDRSRGVPAVTVVFMCGLLSNFHALPAGLTLQSMGCDAGLVDPKHAVAPLWSSEQLLHSFKSVFCLLHACYRNADVSPEALAALREEAGPVDAGDDTVLGLASAVTQKILDLSDVSAKVVSKRAKALARLLPISGKYFAVAGGELYTGSTSQADILPRTAEGLGKLGVQPLIQAACLAARVSGTDAGSQRLWDRLLLGTSAYGAVVDVEGAIHGGIKGPDGRDLFGGDFIDWDWGAGGCPRNMSNVMALECASSPARSHLGCGASLVYGAMRGDRDTMDFLGLEEPLTQANALPTAARIVELIYRRVAAHAASLAAPAGRTGSA